MFIVVWIINAVYYILLILILARVILSFVNIGSYEIRDLVFRLTEPVLAPVRNFLPPMAGMDFSPMIVIIVAELLRRVLISALL